MNFIMNILGKHLDNNKGDQCIKSDESILILLIHVVYLLIICVLIYLIVVSILKFKINKNKISKDNEFEKNILDSININNSVPTKCIEVKGHITYTNLINEDNKKD